MPDFVGTIDPLMEPKLSESDRLLAKMFSRHDKQMEWLARTVIRSHNYTLLMANELQDLAAELGQMRLDEEQRQQQQRTEREEESKAFRKRVNWLIGIVVAAVVEEALRHIAFK